MSFRTDSRELTLIAGLVETIAEATDLERVWRQADQTFAELIGHRMFTVLDHDAETGTVGRLYSSDPEAYPVAGTKPMGPTPWGELVLKQGKPFVGKDAAALRWAYPDHARLFAMGLNSALNMPMRLGAKTLGTLNLTHEAGHYHEGHLQVGSILAALLVPVLLHRRHTQFQT